GYADRLQSLAHERGGEGEDRDLAPEHDMRKGDEGQEPPVRLHEAEHGAVEDQAEINPDRVGNDVPDRQIEVALDEILEAQEVVSRVRLPVTALGVDGPGRDLALADVLGAADLGRDAVELLGFAQLGTEHAVILREPARIVALHIDD